MVAGEGEVIWGRLVGAGVLLRQGAWRRFGQFLWN